jgi:acyl carrier protein
MNGGQRSEADVPAIEQRIRRIWADVLGMREGQQDATFFELMGQSISAVRILARIEDELGITVDVGFLFDDPDLPTFVREVLAKAGTKDTELSGI